MVLLVVFVESEALLILLTVPDRALFNSPRNEGLDTILAAVRWVVWSVIVVRELNWSLEGRLHGAESR